MDNKSLIEANFPCFGKKEDSSQGEAYQYADISLPIKLKPSAALGRIKTECCGEPAVMLRQYQSSCCDCSCEIIITQSVCIKIPIEYNAEAEAGAVSMNCKKGICSDCGKPL